MDRRPKINPLVSLSDSNHDALMSVLSELRRARTRLPRWPTDPLVALAILQEEVGEVTKEVLQVTFEKDRGSSIETVRAEAIQAAAMALRFLFNLDSYQFSASNQHQDSGLEVGFK